MGQWLRSCLPMQETQDTWVCSLDWKIPRVGTGNPHQYSCLEKSMDIGAWQAIVCGVAQSHRKQAKDTSD